ncbi:hypothetical protein BJ875DRAFT_435886 [Amylocarpus encephaloides]|uniref:Zn(2)-C6 fungal-type domain-containing protein n=1 Tax=Amylocarpus encephaloides TaxID=45428 RepID=A0A9P8BZ32_9HELO|nr:hypothetical protein BJ875DRAFT_435886 [Amylocarpus encephaloides]
MPALVKFNSATRSYMSPDSSSSSDGSTVGNVARSGSLLPPMQYELPRDMVSSFRVGGPKSRNGCITCKIRRVKCGEEKPHCQRCMSTDRNCDGYAPPKTTKKKSRSRSPQENNDSRNVYQEMPAIPRGLCLDGIGSYSQRRSFHYFRSRNFSAMAGNFEPYFWDNIVFQFSHIYPTVHQSLLALSAIYEERKMTGGISRRTPITSANALHHYTKAVETLVQYLSSDNQDPRATLISCLLFVWVELLQRNVDAGFQHLYSGLNILADLRASGKVGNGKELELGDIYESLSRSFTRLRIQASIHGSTTDELAKTCPVTTDIVKPIPPSFSNVFEARICLDNDFKAIFGFWRSIREETDTVMAPLSVKKDKNFEYVRLTHLQRLEQWQRTTKKMMTEQGESDSNKLGYAYLELYYTLISLVLKNPGEGEMVYDKYSHNFERMFVLCQELLDSFQSEGTSPLSFDMGVIPPLFYIGLKHRGLPLRRKAMDLLRIAPEQEGLWIRDDTLKFCEWKIEMEEAGRGSVPADQPLPESARIHMEHFWHDRTASKKYIMYMRGRAEDNQLSSIEMTSEMAYVEWMGNIL